MAQPPAKDLPQTRSSPSAQTAPRGFTQLFEPAPVTGKSGARLHPMAISFVESYMVRYGSGLRKMRDWGRPYFEMMDQVLSQYGLPSQLKYLAVIESGLKSTAVSWAGAVGPWQFMPATARRYGLTVTYALDQRTDYIKSTHAAARYLRDLYAEFNDWLLVIAAYNGGEGRVRSAIQKSGSNDFWTLQYQLPAESMNHVKKFIATHYVFEEDGGETTLTLQERKQKYDVAGGSPITEEEKKQTTTLLITGRYKKEAILKYTETDRVEFIRYNPNFDEQLSAQGSYTLRLSPACMQVFVEKKAAILEESLQLLLRGIRR
ncbi:MAG: lytic transglycosylase domain-containing protein [Chitinophagia bacterium]|nr:lytic transglycosylase domain-containing protein [Chitinophagia bacterium]